MGGGETDKSPEKEIFGGGKSYSLLRLGTLDRKSGNDKTICVRRWQSCP